MLDSDPHIEGEIQRLLAEDADIAELGIDIACEAGAVVLRGCVTTPQRRAAIVGRVRAAFPGHNVRDEIAVAGKEAPSQTEEVR
jgi:hypothetical protein